MEKQMLEYLKNILKKHITSTDWWTGIVIHGKYLSGAITTRRYITPQIIDKGLDKLITSHYLRKHISIEGMTYNTVYAEVDWTILPPGIYKLCIHPNPWAVCGNYAGYIELPSLKEVKLAYSPPPGQFTYGKLTHGCKTFEFKKPVIVWVNSTRIDITPIKIYKFTPPTTHTTPKTTHPTHKPSTSKPKHLIPTTTIHQTIQHIINKQSHIKTHTTTTTPKLPTYQETKEQESIQPTTPQLPELTTLILPLLTIILINTTLYLLNKIFKK